MGMQEEKLTRELKALKQQRTKKEGINTLKNQIAAEKRGIRRAKYGSIVGVGKVLGKGASFAGKAGLKIIDEATKPKKGSSMKKKKNPFDMGGFKF